jgi:hypothetical protein
MSMFTLNKAILLGLLVGTVTSTQAISSGEPVFFRDIDEIPLAQRFVSSANVRVEGTFDIRTGDGDSVTIGLPYHNPAETWSDIAGFRPSTDTIESAWAWFYFRDDQDAKLEAVRIALDRIPLSTTGNPTPIGNLAFTIFDGSAAGAIEALQVDGILQYKITQVSGDFFFDYARLDVNATRVPDAGATATLLGLGGLGLIVLRRKLS